MRLRIRASLGALALAATTAWAGDEAALCKSSDTPFEARVAACAAVIAAGDAARAPWPHERLGDAYKDAGDHAAAIPHFTRALEIDPDYEAALAGRAYALEREERLDEALADARRAAQVDPDDHYNRYLQGKILARMKRWEEAVAAYSEAIARRDDYYWSWRGRGTANDALDRHQDAISDMLAAAGLEPLSAAAYAKLGSIYFDLDDRVNSARYYRIADILAPNLFSPQNTLQYIVALQDSPDLPPLAYTPPAAGLTIRYLQVLLPRDTRDEMEKAIDELFDWFSPVEKAEPEMRMIMTRTMEPAGDAVSIRLRLEAEEGKDSVARTLPTGIVTFRGLFNTRLAARGDMQDAPVVDIVYEGADPADLWPLEPGKTLTGTGRYILQCPDHFVLPAMVMGCRIGMDSLELGALDYSFTVEGTEEIHVPLGTFKTYVLRYRERSVATIMGLEKSREIETKWWVAPALNFWVKRTNQQGDKIVTIHAVDVVREGE